MSKGLACAPRRILAMRCTPGCPSDCGPPQAPLTHKHPWQPLTHPPAGATHCWLLIAPVTRVVRPPEQRVQGRRLEPVGAPWRAAWCGLGADAGCELPCARSRGVDARHETRVRAAGLAPGKWVATLVSAPPHTRHLKQRTSVEGAHGAQGRGAVVQAHAGAEPAVCKLLGHVGAGRQVACGVGQAEAVAPAAPRVPL